MKNIHLLPIDKPSRLHFDSELFITPKIQLSKSINSIVEGRNIYITSDEKIKEGEYYIHGNRLHKHLGKTCLDVLTNKEYPQSSFINKDSVFKKIILTTDTDLIKDGIQPILDDFLEWFIKNPSCEEVEIIKGSFDLNPTEKTLLKENYVPENTFDTYKIIIPKEEPLSYEDFRGRASNDLIIKFDTDCSRYSEDGDSDSYFYSNSKYWENKLKEEPKQERERGVIINHVNKKETLEEASKKYALYKKDLKHLSNREYDLCRNDFIEGAKWQQEQDKNKFSKEDMIATFHYAHQIGMNSILAIQSQHSPQPIPEPDLELLKKEWFQQFKKK